MHHQPWNRAASHRLQGILDWRYKSASKPAAP